MNKNKFLFNQISIIGVGLIGGSFGMAVKKNKLCQNVIGFARRKETIKQALKLKAIDIVRELNLLGMLSGIN